MRPCSTRNLKWLRGSGLSQDECELYCGWLIILSSVWLLSVCSDHRRDKRKASLGLLLVEANSGRFPSLGRQRNAATDQDNGERCAQAPRRNAIDASADDCGYFIHGVAFQLVPNRLNGLHFTESILYFPPRERLTPPAAVELQRTRQAIYRMQRHLAARPVKHRILSNPLAAILIATVSEFVIAGLDACPGAVASRTAGCRAVGAHAAIALRDNNSSAFNFEPTGVAIR
jgi:hypothetical protein